MNTIKTLVLGSAAGLLAMGGAQAADLPVKAKAVEYVRICSLYGAGFFYIPGTDTCIKLGGYVRVDTTFNGSTQDQPAWSADLGQGNRYRDYLSTRARLALTVDTRTATEYGVVRTFGQGDFTFDELANSTFNPNFLNTNLGNNVNLLSSPGNGFVVVENLFIQFAGFTFGKSSSAYATPWHGYLGGQNSSYLLGGHDTVTGVNNIQYTAQFGNGVSGTIGLDDPVVYNRTSVFNLNVGLSALGVAGNAYAGVHAPDVVGNIRVDQAWGLFQISAAAHEVNGSYNILAGSALPAGMAGFTAGSVSPSALSEISGHPDTKWGGSVMAALQIKNIPTGPGDDLKFDASYAKGDTKQVISTSAGSPVFAMFSGSGVGAYQSLGFGATSDAIYLPVISGGTGDLKLTTAYGVRGAFNHNWDPFWSTSVWGSYSAVRYDGTVGDLTTAKGQYCAVYNFSSSATAAGRAANAATSTCNPDFNVAMVGVTTRWTPVKNLTFSAEALWMGLDQKFSGTAVLTPTAPKPTAVYEYKDQNTVSFNVRAQRNF
jgi:Porin subfamily